MSSELRIQLNNIVEEKNAKILPENIKKGVTIYGVEGTIVETDFSDITATASDIKQGVSAYGKDGEKLEGTYVPFDTSDATATASNLDKGVIAYTKDNERIVGTTTLLDATAEPLTLPFAGKGGGGTGTVINLTEYIPVVYESSSGGEFGQTILFPTSKLPVDIAGKNIVLRVAPRSYYYESYSFCAELLIAPSMDNWFDVRRDSSRDLIRCWSNDESTRTNFQYYRIAFSGDGHTIEEITADKWEDRGLVSVTSEYRTNNSWYRFSTKNMINKGGLGAGQPYQGRGDDCFVKTTLGSSAPIYKLKQGGVLINRVPNAEVAKAIGLTADDIISGKSYLGITGTADIESFLEYDDCLDVATQILTGESLMLYEFLEYIESSGEQYIDTGICPIAGNTSAEVDFQITQNRTGEQWAFGQWTGFVSGVSNGNGWRCGVSNGAFDTAKGFTYSGTNFTSRVTATSTASTITASYPMFLFCQQEVGTPAYLGNSYIRIYGCKIWESGILVRDFVPARHKTIGTLGMYDLVTKTLYTNAGTGTFIAGSVVEEV